MCVVYVLGMCVVYDVMYVWCMYVVYVCGVRMYVVYVCGVRGWCISVRCMYVVYVCGVVYVWYTGVAFSWHARFMGKGSTIHSPSAPLKTRNKSSVEMNSQAPVPVLFLQPRISGSAGRLAYRLFFKIIATLASHP